MKKHLTVSGMLNVGDEVIYIPTWQKGHVIEFKHNGPHVMVKLKLVNGGWIWAIKDNLAWPYEGI